MKWDLRLKAVKGAGMLEKTLEILKHEFRMTELDAGAYARQKVKGMTFLVHHYEAEGIGHLSTMAADGMFGLMKMDTVILVPRLKDHRMRARMQKMRSRGNMSTDCFKTAGRPRMRS